MVSRSEKGGITLRRDTKRDTTLSEHQRTSQITQKQQAPENQGLVSHLKHRETPKNVILYSGSVRASAR